MTKDKSAYFKAILPLCCVWCGVLVACGKSPTAKLDNKSAPASTASAISELSDSARTPTAPPPKNPRDFGEMFSNEAAARPSGTIKVEDVLAAFKKDGIELNTVRQHLAKIYGARYCVGGLSGTDVAISVCEYIDPAAASVGAENSRKIVLANREIKINEATTLSTREVAKNAASEAMVARMFAIFEKLK